jgi:hypothetical protein
MKGMLSLLAVAGLASAMSSVRSVDGTELVRVPGRGLLPASCVNSVPSGTVSQRHPSGGIVSSFPNGTVVHFPPCFSDDLANDDPFPSDYDGWPAYVVTNVSTSFDVFNATFTVPNLPKDDPDVLYLFTGLQNVNWIPKVVPLPTGPFDVIQPVLQYPGDWGNYWSVKSWYVTLKDGATASDEVVLSPGDTVFGGMVRLTGPYNQGAWAVVSTDTSNGATTTTIANDTRLITQPWGYITLECYGCTGCTTYPTKPSVFSNMVLSANGESFTPSWDLNPFPSPHKFCDETISVSSSSVTVKFT